MSNPQYNKNQNYKDDSIIPELVAGTIATGLLAAGAYKGKDALKEIGQGALEGGLKGFNKGINRVMPKKSKGMTRTFTDLARGAVNKSRKHFGNFDSFVDEYKAANNLPFGEKLDRETMSKLYDEFSLQEDKISEHAKNFEDHWRFKNNLQGSSRLSRTQSKDIKQKAQEAWDAMDETEKSQMWRSFVGDVGSKGNRKKDKVIDGALGGVGFGLASSGVTFGAHALGEKYFDKQDDDKVRKLIQNSYSDGNNRRRSPNSRAYGYVKQAALSPEVKGKLVKGLKNAGLVGAAGAADAAIINGLPMAISKATGVDLRTGLKKKDDDVNNGLIVIDVPMASMTKKASIQDIASKVKSSEEVTKFLEKRRDTALRVAPWLVAGNLVRGIGNEDEKALPDVKDGMARITIQRPGQQAQNNNEFLMRKASVEKADIDKILEGINKNLEEVVSDDYEKGTRKAVNHKPKEGLTGRSNQIKKI